MKTRTAISLLLVGTAMLTFGGLFKLMHWPSANIQLLLGGLVQVVALLTLAASVARKPDLKELLER